MTRPSSVDVLIVGAGPTGLMLGCQLSLFPSISFRIIDKTEGSSTQTRATVFHARSIEAFSQINLDEKLMAKGQTLDSVRLFVQGKKRCEIDLIKMRTENASLTRYPYVYTIAQCITEGLMENYLNERNIYVERQTEASDFVDLDTSENSEIQVTLSTGEVLRTKYLCGCDGARSIVRHKLNLPFFGRTFSQSLFVADVALFNLPLEKRQFGLFLESSGLVAMFPFPEEKYRLVGTEANLAQEGAGFSIEQMQNVLQTRTRNNEIKVYETYWSSSYRSHHRRVESFRCRKRYFLLGDAAHIHSPVGGQGMNTGLQDAQNLGWKIGHTLIHKANDRLLDTYHDERSAVATRLVNTVDKAFSFVSSTVWKVKFFRLYIYPFILRFVVQPLFLYSKGIRAKAFRRLSQLAITYRKSNPHNWMASSGNFAETTPVPGDRFPYVVFGPCVYHLVIFDKDQGRVKPFVDKIKADYPELIKIHDAQAEKVPFQFGGAFLVRPDSHIAYRTNTFDIDHFENYFRKFYPKQT